ncbi:MAG: hypothetical protein MN733_31735, partial [Nitrososphaera sp.]|nr:hypothetical protein [Nitrososphaera sp.]
AKAMVKVAKAYAEAKEYDQALQIAKAIDPALFRVDAIAEIASNYSETGQSEQAFQIVGTIPEDPDALAPKAEALAKISRKYAEIGQKDKALETVTQALSLAKLAPGDYFKAKALAEIAGAYARGGDYDKATQVAKTIKDVPLNAVALTKIASALADTGNMIDLFK